MNVAVAVAVAAGCCCFAATLCGPSLSSSPPPLSPRLTFLVAVSAPAEGNRQHDGHHHPSRHQPQPPHAAAGVSRERPPPRVRDPVALVYPSQASPRGAAGAVDGVADAGLPAEDASEREGGHGRPAVPLHALEDVSRGFLGVWSTTQKPKPTHKVFRVPVPCIAIYSF